MSPPYTPHAARRPWRPRHVLTRPPAALVGAVYAILAAATARPSWGLLLGLLGFPLVEYIVHRWAFHGAARWWPAAYDRIHGAHHRLPSDPGRRIVPLSHSLPVALLVYAVLPGPVVAGLVLGYLVYEGAHSVAHRRGWLPGWLRGLRRHHMLHHLADDTAFGVTTRWWDHVLGTMPKKPGSLR